MLVEKGKAHFLIDPGSYNPMPDADTIDAILITHNHQDHLDIEMLKKLLSKHKDAQIITNQEVANTLKEKGIETHVIVAEGDSLEVNGVAVHAHGGIHAFVYEDVPQCQNIGFMIDSRFYFPGDSLYIPDMPVEILALPIVAPWMKLSEAIEFARQVKPKIVFPVHDGFLRADRAGWSRSFPKMILEPLGIEFRDMQDGSVEMF